MTRYRWVAARKAEGFPTTAACQVAKVSRQAFYGWRGRQAAGPSPAQLADAELVAEMRQIHADSGGAYGSPRVAAELRRRGRCVNRKRVERLMRQHGICGIHKRRRPRWRRDSAAQQAPPDLVRRRFGPGRPDSVWAGDITYIPTGEGWLYLAAVLDIGSRRLIGYSMAADMPARLVIDALDTAAASRGHRTAGIVFHSDRGSQYLSAEFSAALARHQMRQSAGRVGNCWDNSVSEAFFASLKRELVHQRRFATRDQARREIFAWIARYNTQRLHSTLDYQTPTEWEDHHDRQRLDQAA